MGVLSKELSVPDDVTAEAARICRNGLERGVFFRKPVEQVSAASLYAACRMGEVPRTLDEVAAASRVGRLDLAGCYRMLVKELDLRVPVADPAEYMAEVASRAKASPAAQVRALEILSRAEEAGISAGKYPSGLTASALYMAAAEEGEKLTQKGAADAAGVQEATIRREYHRLRKLL